MRLLAERGVDPDTLGAGARAFLLRETGAETPQALRMRILEVTRAAAAVIDRILPPPEG
jgi:[glutamine synthetase] adenylyltransferase / [glutamine synthetase]-adenylyl-L-tyrosine phosphorylase